MQQTIATDQYQNQAGKGLHEFTADNRVHMGAKLRRLTDTRYLIISLLAVAMCALRPCGVLGDVCSVPNFGLTIPFSAGPDPVFAAVGDFNGDGKADLAVVNQGSFDNASQGHTNDFVSILLGKGDGTFQGAVNYAVGTNPVFVVIGDFNRDGNLDLAVANQGSYDQGGSISALLGNGDGTFQPARDYAAGADLGLVAPGHLSVGDLNGDGNADLVVANRVYSGYNGLSVLFGKGDGTFQAATSITNSEASQAFSVRVGDFNGDGKVDLVTTDYSQLSVLLGNGDGTFRTVAHYDMDAEWLVTGDFNGDGKTDLAVVVGSDPFVDANVLSLVVLLGKGDGTFQSLATNKAGILPDFHAGAPIVPSDFDGDGTLDMIVANGFFGSNSLLLGNGDGTFHLRSATATNLNLAFSGVLAEGDFNGDGRPDLVSPYAVSLNLGASPPAAPNFALLGQFPVSGYSGTVAVGDFNGDDKLDLAVANPESQGYGKGDYVAILLGAGGGTFGPAVGYDISGSATSIAAGDFNRDGKLDLAVAKSGTNNDISVLLGRGDGTFRGPVNYGVGTNYGESQSIVVGDFNGDANLDLAVATGQGVSVLYGKGDGTFQPALQYDLGIPGSDPSPGLVAVGDFNGDGRPDLVVGASGTLWVLWHGYNAFQAGIDLGVYQPVAVEVGDFNGDGRSDVAVAFADYLGVFGGHFYLGTLLSDGEGGFQAHLDSELQLYPRAIASGDFNGDGKPDLIIVGVPGYSLHLGNGDGTFQVAFEEALHHTEIEYSSVAVGDFNGDHLPDFVEIQGNGLFQFASIWLNTSCFPRPQLSLVHKGTSLDLSWPLAAAGYVLESSTTLQPGSWQPVSISPIGSNQTWQLTLPSSEGSQKYFRLRQP